jgi:hypothetical protein
MRLARIGECLNRTAEVKRMLLSDRDLQAPGTSALSAPYHPVPLVIRGVQPILELQPLLVDLCLRCDQSGRWQHLSYFLSLPFAYNKTPYLLLFVSRPGLSPKTLSSSNLVAAVLTYEYRLWRVPSRIFVTDDPVGRRTVIAPTTLRSQITLEASQFLMNHGAGISLISYQDDLASPSLLNDLHYSPQRLDALWTSQKREFFSYLQLERDYQATLANLGKRTRTHMRYYRKRAERDLHCTFVPNVTISKAGFQQFNRACSFPVTDEACSIRYDTCFDAPDIFIAGLRDQEGKWLSIVGGNKEQESINVYWQMNLNSVPAYSISTVMRAFLIEYAVDCHARRLYMEGGTSHSMQFSFVREVVTDVLVRRKSPLGLLLTRVARNLLQEENFLSQLLDSKTLPWQSGNTAPLGCLASAAYIKIDPNSRKIA